ncbi:hypothetical protein [uncultured Roseibium sp.]|uniref:hypothetical protein n=1 Tax=uncultured Roseibium sp. TaxID=1936171 RepID=UPI00262F1CC0|nr:hypothetical protein [uncultured Roseibium sp.]
MKSLFTFRFNLPPNKDSRDVLVVFVATPAIDAQAFATEVEAEIEANLVPDEVVVIVRDPVFEKTEKALRTDSMHLATLSRLGKSTAVLLIGYDCMGNERRRKCITEASCEPAVALNDFQRRGITSIFNERRGFVEATATYHFENPSGRHTERFIRLSNILARGAEIAFIGFCCLPHISPLITVAYLDTPSLYAVVSAINEQRSLFDEATWIMADNFSSYAGFEQHHFDSSESAIVLISASSSGSLARRLVSEKNVEPDRIVHLLYLGNSPSDPRVVCDLSHDPHENPAGIDVLPSVEESNDCAMCAGGSHAIKLQGDQFEFAGPQQDALLVGKAHAPAGLASLMDRYVGDKVFELGLGRSTSRLPRQFHINSTQLLASKSFKDKLDYALRRSLPASLEYIIIANSVSEPLAKVIEAELPNAPSIVSRDELDAIPVATQ